MKNFIIFICFFSIVGTLLALPITFTNGETLQTNIDSQSNMIAFDGNIEHIFTHCLLAYPSLALSEENNMKQYYEKDCITPNEFSLILKELYENNYVLININDIFENINGKIIKKKVFVPEGKKPLILSFDDVNYDQKKLKKGMVDKIIVDEQGNLASETEITWSTTKKIDISYDNEFIPILENFIKTYPDFSVNGAKGTICLTGYDGILGYRTSKKNTVNRQQEINSAKIVVDKLKTNGWNFACHSFGHYHMKNISDEQFKQELENWKEQVEPIIGETNIYVYPYGEWELTDDNNNTSIKHQMLIDYGFQLFCGVGSNPFFSYMPLNTSGTKSLFMDRTPIDGYSLKNRKKELLRFFNADEVYDFKYRT